jgi:hypothetical protein
MVGVAIGLQEGLDAAHDAGGIGDEIDTATSGGAVGLVIGGHA